MPESPLSPHSTPGARPSVEATRQPAVGDDSGPINQMPNTSQAVTDRNGIRPWGLPWLLSGGWIDREAAQRVFDGDSWRGWFGRGPTLVCAYIWCFFATWPVTIAECAGIPLLVCTVLRFGRNFRYVRSIVLQPLFMAAAVFWIVQWVSGWWAIDRRQWLEQSGQVRWLWAVGVVWPVIQYRRSLLLAAAMGLLIGNATQLSQFLHVELGWPTPTWNRAADRYSGWWPPVVCGTLLVAALGMHLPAAMLPGRARERILAGIAAGITLAGIFASGTRGAWLAGAGLVGVCGAIAGTVWIRDVAKRSRESAGAGAAGRMTWIAALVVIAIAIGGGAIAWDRLGDSIGRRYQLAREEIAAAVDHGEYRSDTGARIGMAIWAMDLFREHPLGGVGAGSYKPAVGQLLSRRGGDPSMVVVHDHAHNAILHIAATTGLAGLAPALLVIVLAVRNAWMLGVQRWRERGGYEWGPLAALAGLLLVSAFDPVHLNAQTGALLALVLSLCPSFVPGGSPPAPGVRA